MSSEFPVNKRDIEFVLFEQLRIEELRRLPAYRECSRELLQMVIDEAIKIATDVMAPLNASGDREGCSLENGEVHTPAGCKKAYGQFAAGGWNGLAHSPEYGGQGLPNLLKSAAAEIFAGANVAFYLTSILTEGTAHLIEKFGAESLRQKYCEKLYTGEWAGTMCLTEPSAGSDVGNLKTVARRNGDDYLITGTKIFITCGEHDLTPNIVHAVLARLEGAPPGSKGISLFLVPRQILNDDGTIGERNDVHCSSIEHKMGIKASPTCTLNFGDEGRCRGWLLGEENQGMRAMFQMMNEARLGVGIQGLALASVAYLSALSYAQERVQGTHWSRAKEASAPRIAIIEHPDIRRALMHMKCQIDGMRSMMSAVNKYIDLSIHAEDQEDRERFGHLVELLTPISKTYGSDQGFRLNEMAIQIFAGYGYCQEYPVEQYCRDQKITSIYEGTSGIQAIDLLGRKVVGRGRSSAREFLEMVSALIEQNQKSAQFAPLLGKLADARDALVRVTTVLSEAMGKDTALALLRASPYLEMFGHVAVGYFLLDGAVLAWSRLQEIFSSAAANDESTRKRVLDQNGEAAFYHGRVASARFFVHEILPQVHALEKSILSGDRSALEVVFPK